MYFNERTLIFIKEQQLIQCNRFNLIIKLSEDFLQKWKVDSVGGNCDGFGIEM